METTAKSNTTKVATKWALIYAAAAIIITYAIEFLDLDPNSPVKFITFVPFIIFMLLAQIEFKQQLNGFITFGEAFSTGFRYALFSGLLMAVFTYLYFSVLSSTAMDKALAISQAKMEEQNAPAEAIEKSEIIMRKYGAVIFAFGFAISYAFFGAIISLITAAIVKKQRSAYDIIEDAIDPTE